MVVVPAEVVFKEVQDVGVARVALRGGPVAAGPPRFVDRRTVAVARSRQEHRARGFHSLPVREIGLREIGVVRIIRTITIFVITALPRQTIACTRRKRQT